VGQTFAASSFGHPDNTHNYPLQLTIMDSFITTKQLLLGQDAKSCLMKNRQNGALGNHMENMATL
jgi:hypothetical protein